MRDEQGRLIQSGMFKDGKPHGVLRKFDQEGSPISEKTKYLIDNEEVTEEQFRGAAMGDKVLKESLENIPPRQTEPRKKIAPLPKPASKPLSAPSESRDEKQ
ncbi:MAG: hypothetical protein ACKV0T_12070 [Planctomycetales bacterium]